MSTNALNQVYKTGILAVEEAQVTSDLVAGDPTPPATTIDIPVHGYYMTAKPFADGDYRPYILRDDRFVYDNALGMDVPNSERITILSITGETATPLGDGIGYEYAATLKVQGYGSNGWGGGLHNSYLLNYNPTILTPGVEMAIQNSDFNCRFKTLTDAPKVDFDDEASRFATGDEGRDLSIAGARSGEITFTQKLAWAGNTYTSPVWSKIMRSMGHVKRIHKAYQVGGPVNPTSYATLLLLIAGNMYKAGDKFHSADGSDTTDNALAAIKGSAIEVGDSFICTGDDGIPNHYATGATFLTPVGIEFLPMPEANEVTATIWIINPENGASPSNTVYRYRGAHGGNGSSLAVGKIGDVYMLTAKYNAAFVSTMEIPFSNVRVLTSPETNIPEVMLNNTVSVPATVNGANMTKNVEISQFSLDFGGVVNPFIDQSTSTGNAYFATQDRDPRLTVNPYMVRKNLDDIDNTVSNMKAGMVKIQSAPTNPHVTVELPNAQLLSPAYASREGYINTNRTYRALRNDTGAGAIDNAMPVSVMYGILIGKRTYA
jgi:hypothetical protein